LFPNPGASYRGHRVGLTADGGPGDDRLEAAGPVGATLTGGGGRDTLRGSRGFDTLIDGDVSGHADRDVLDGRGSGGEVSYARRTRRLHVDLADSRPDGEHGEGDVLRRITGVIGGTASDFLRGEEEANSLFGRAGDDRLDGRGGDDFVDRGRGDDALRGGAGADSLSRRASSDGLAGGMDHDTLFGGRGHDFPPRRPR
jgi:Ca2+-binding RTX toxin-like protein